MVNATIALLSKQGYHGTGLNEIVSEAQAPKGSMYHHFPGGKEQLVAEAVTQAGHYVAGRISEGTTAVEVGELLVDRLIRRLRKTDYGDGCAIASTTLDVASVSDVVRDACAGAFDEWKALIVRHLVDGGAFHRTAQAAATVAISAIEGALVLSRAHRDVTALYDVREALPRLLAG